MEVYNVQFHLLGGLPEAPSVLHCYTEADSAEDALDVARKNMERGMFTFRDTSGDATLLRAESIMFVHAVKSGGRNSIIGLKRP